VAFSLDPEIEQVLGPVFALMREAPRPASGDVAARRSVFDAGPDLLDRGRPFPAEVAPEYPGAIPVEDCYAGLRWLADHAERLGVDPKRLAVMGDSGGGGLAAGLAILARDRGISLARQILIYPMLDDRNVTPDPELEPTAMWTYADNVTAWDAVLGEERGADSVSASIAAARIADAAGLPPAYLEVGELDIFRDECLAYAQLLLQAGVSTEFHLHRGSPMAATSGDLTSARLCAHGRTGSACSGSCESDDFPCKHE
jgi:hypothetical protein